MEKDLKILIGERIRELRKKLNITIEQLGNRLDIAPSHIAQIERGEKFGSIQLLNKIAKCLNIDLPTLVDFKKKPKIDKFSNEIYFLVEGLSEKEKRLLIDFIKVYKKQK